MPFKRPHAVKARVNGYVVVLTLSDGTVIERDFTFVFGSAFKKWRRDPDGIDPRVRLNGNELAWPNGIDFDVDTVIWGGNKTRRRPLQRAVVGAQGSLAPAPWVSEL